MDSVWTSDYFGESLEIMGRTTERQAVIVHSCLFKAFLDVEIYRNSVLNDSNDSFSIISKFGRVVVSRMPSLVLTLEYPLNITSTGSKVRYSTTVRVQHNLINLIHDLRPLQN